jgi:hypothetical protein
MGTNIFFLLLLKPTSISKTQNAPKILKIAVAFIKIYYSQTLHLNFRPRTSCSLSEEDDFQEPYKL